MALGGRWRVALLRGSADSDKNPESPESAESAESVKNPESAESVKNPESPESVKNPESPESPKKHEAPAPPESPKKRHLLLENGFNIACEPNFNHPSLLEADEDFRAGAPAAMAVLGGAGGLYCCEEVLIRVGCWGAVIQQ